MVIGRIWRTRPWLELDQAAKQLSNMFDEEVTAADLIQLALENKIKMSVNLIGVASGKRGQRVTRTVDEIAAMLKSGEVPSDFPWIKRSLLELPSFVREMYSEDTTETISFGNTQISDEEWIYWTNPEEVDRLDGVWDLPLIGGETISLEQKYQELVGGPFVDLINIDGTYVEAKNGDLYKLYERFSGKYKVEEKEPYFNIGNYFPIGNLPADSVFVLRTEELVRFAENAGSSERREEKVLAGTSRTTLLTIIDALCKRAGIDASKRGAAAEIKKITEEIGRPVSDDQIRRYLDELIRLR